jgi:serine phosphatase RsbU (regulator of sigma subunit)
MLESDSSFATATCGVLDLERRTFRFAGAGGPPILRVHGDGRMEVLESPGFPLGLVADAEFEETSTELDPGDRLLLFTDGALEVMNSAGNLANVDGVIELLRSQGYPRRDICMGALEESLLRYSSAIRLQDDLTLIEIRLREVTGRRVERHAADRCKGS